MNEIEFSVIADLPDDILTLTRLLQAFEQQGHAQVKLTRMSWDEAWSKLFSVAIYGQGPHISQIGSTWGSSLSAMRALRPFTPPELAAIGAPDAFMPPAWQSATLPGYSQVWTIPWTAYTFVICYRRDLLEQAGVGERTAFATAADMAQTLHALQTAGVEVPWIIPTAAPYPDLIHIIASWVWGAGGDFISHDGKQVLFNSHQSLAGLKSFFQLYRFLPSSIPELNAEQAITLFAQGKAAVLIAGAEVPYGLAQAANGHTEVRTQLGVAPPPGVPWIGGDNLVIWNHVHEYQLERTCLDLVKFLTSLEFQTTYLAEELALPVRLEALSPSSFRPDSLASTIAHVMRTGRAHHAVSLWTRIEHRLGRALNQIATEIVTDSSADLDNLLQEHLEPLAHQLNRVLTG
ncbi:MAG: extracellular solute-binding protein [Chloroflexi bacterium]|nr:extracellular solute-binding protein [Chloroflexota bacterium]MCI0578065.1 extracellular solute-binding protein [Chloroflexota bacterium]MCI0646053.1 extracellular solute-binding protein [Chloroflexota bacterium]MCI0732041.1 extracellular solute-binding protein [Chloroflexota bacterium]